MAKPVCDEKLFDIMYSCRSMRRFKPDPVPDEVLVQLVDAAMQGPSGRDAQNWAFVIVKDPKVKEQIQEVWRRVWAFYTSTIGSADLGADADTQARERLTRAGTYMVEHLHETPAIIFVGARKDPVVASTLAAPTTLIEATRHLGVETTMKLLASSVGASATFAGSTAFPAVQNILLAARALGLGAVLTTPHWIGVGELEAIVGVPSDFTVAAVIPVGYPKGKFGPVSRPAPESVIHWDRYRG